jgi:UDP-N-acetylglucosamine:LPS N-acetylglucosamine transferase
MQKGENLIGADPDLAQFAHTRLESDSFTARQPSAKPAKRILATASGGGHWVQLCRLMPVFKGHDMAYLTTAPGNRADVPLARFYSIGAASLWNKLALVRMAIQVFWILLRERPEVIISTGAAIGYFAIRFGKLLGARTIWIDSIANVNKLSISGRHVGRYADLWLTQWPQLAQPEGPLYLGAVV